MGLLSRILPIVDELTAAKAAVEEALRQITYSQDREAIRSHLREAAVKAEKAGAQLSNLARAIDAGFGTLPETPADPDAPKDDPEVTQMLLSLVSVEVPLKTVEGWTPEQRAEADAWAGAVHLKASDNDGVVVPARPAFLAAADDEGADVLTAEGDRDA